jgi:hypothetical protein
MRFTKKNLLLDKAIKTKKESNALLFVALNNDYLGAAGAAASAAGAGVAAASAAGATAAASAAGAAASTGAAAGAAASAAGAGVASGAGAAASAAGAAASAAGASSFLAQPAKAKAAMIAADTAMFLNCMMFLSSYKIMLITTRSLNTDTVCAKNSISLSGACILAVYLIKITTFVEQFANKCFFVVFT